MQKLTIPLPDLGWSAYFQSQLSLEECETHIPLRVTDVHRNAIELIGEDGHSRSPQEADTAKAGIVVGDWILQQRGQLRIDRVLDRKSLIKRKTAGTAVSTQHIAANIDTMFIVSSCNADFNIARLERYVALARQAMVEPVVILTKVDLCDDPYVYVDQARELRDVLIETLDATSSDAVKKLEPWCNKGQTVALVGSSGVGKTTLSNTLTGLEIVTQEIREDDAKGRHTTTGRSMHRMITGGWLIDTPGMRALKMVDAWAGVEAVFEDITALAIQCRFNDCQHETEPGCMVLRAIDDGSLDSARLKRWQKLQREDVRNTQTVVESIARKKEWAQLMKGGKAQGKAKRGEFD